MIRRRVGGGAFDAEAVNRRRNPVLLSGAGQWSLMSNRDQTFKQEFEAYLDCGRLERG